MINRYLGNKNEVILPLLKVIGQHADQGDHVVDLFSGSLTVSMALKDAGYRVTANDVNLLSHTIGAAFVEPSSLPLADTSVVPRREHATLRREAEAILSGTRSRIGFTKTVHAGLRSDAVALIVLVLWLNRVQSCDLPKRHRRTDFFDTYCEDGANSAFTSSRGTSGRRRFFSPQNAERIDAVLNQLRLWVERRTVDPTVIAYLLSCVMRATEKVANTQGTFHDFPRKTWDSRALKPIQLLPMPTDPMLSQIGGHRVGKEQDSRDFIKSVDAHSVLYLDPPYNFRQYSAYYFLLNLISRYPYISDVDDYFSKVKYVRGQNPDDDFNSTFCKASRFIDDMGDVMNSADCETVVVSYYTGRNHWSSFDADRDDTGFNLLRELMTGSMFDTGSFRALELDRRNYASYGGYKARTVKELILVARKRS